jgi:hypothetical protein
MAISRGNRGEWVKDLLTAPVVAVLIGAVLFSSPLIPAARHVPGAIRVDRRESYLPVADILPQALLSRHFMVNILHKSVSARGMTIDQVCRGLMALVYLGMYPVRRLYPIWQVRTGVAISCLLGAGAFLSDIASYWLLGGVVDWIGISAHGALAPSDICLLVAPFGILLSAAAAWVYFLSNGRRPH